MQLVIDRGNAALQVAAGELVEGACVCHAHVYHACTYVVARAACVPYAFPVG